MLLERIGQLPYSKLQLLCSILSGVSGEFVRGSCKVAAMMILRFFFYILILMNGVRSEFPKLEGLLRKLDEERAPASVQENAARGVLQRLIPSHVSSFQFTIVSEIECGGNACFIIDNHDSFDEKGSLEIDIKGTTAVELLAGLHWYLKYWCVAHVSWDKTGGVQLASIPPQGSLPRVENGGVRIQRAIPWNYYQNVVTSSYSYVWWNWERWEKEIDWMALQGVNLPLAFTGQETIWQKVFQRFNLSKSDLNDFFGGPAFLAWARMGNLHGWGGPLPQSWFDQQLILQKRILSRMRELGMTPVLPGFAGNVPAALKKIFPFAKVTQLGDWNTVNGDPRWCCTFLLDPTDALFVQIGQAFVQQQIKEYGGTSHIYNCDTFNENAPPTNNPGYISALGAAVFKAMHAGDKDAVWLMQGWLFSSDAAFWKPPQMKALLHSVPSGRMIVLDLFAEVKPIWSESDQFYGTPYIWCMLHNFGGNIEMYGVLDAIASGPVDARTSQNSTMVGVGTCMEGIEQNPVVYELMSEMAFRGDKVIVEEWVQNYSYRRYGKVVPTLEEAWDILYQTLYNCTDGIADHNRDFIVQFPDVDPSSALAFQVTKRNKMLKFAELAEPRRLSFQEMHFDLQPHLWYSTSKVIRALRLFLDGGDALANSLTYRYDLIDLSRQALAKLANQIYLDIIMAFHQKDAKEVAMQSQKFLDLITDLDILLASDDNFLLGPWLESAKQLATNPRQRRQYEWNARTQVTMWFDNTKLNQSKLHDYANKYWSGLLKNYYLPRASTYFNYLLESMKANESFPLDTWRKSWIMLSNKWQEGTDLYSVKAEGNAVNISRALFQKYFKGLSI